MRTVGELLFPAPLPLKLEPWELPTNIIHQPLIAFTALRGFAPCLSELPWWKRMDAGPPPNQAFVWSLGGMPLLTYFIAPMPAQACTIKGRASATENLPRCWMSAFKSVPGTYSIIMYSCP